MALNPFFADGTVSAALAAMTALLNGGFAEIYTGTQPADANTAVGAQVLLATVSLGTPAFAAPVASGTAPSRVVTTTANPATAGTAVASGTAAWFRAYQSDGATAVMDGSCGLVSGFDMVISATAVVTGDLVSVTSWTLTQAE